MRMYTCGLYNIMFNANSYLDNYNNCHILVLKATNKQEQLNINA